MNRIPPLVATLLAAGLAAGCTSPSGGGPNLPFSPNPAVMVQEGPAPSATHDASTLRVDEVHRRGNTVTLGLTVGRSRTSNTVLRHSFQITSNTGVKTPLGQIQQREIPADGVATLAIAVPLPDDQTTELNLSLWDEKLGVTVPLPQEDGGFLWRPAAVREVALPPTPHRTERTDLAYHTLRSEGLVTELTFRGISASAMNFDLCPPAFARNCTLTEANGTVHPLIGATRGAPQYARQHGTLRFLGELAPDTQEISISVPSAWGDNPDPFQLTLPAHADSAVRAVAGDTARTSAAMQPLTLTDKNSGASATLKKIEVLSDRVQVEATLKAGPHKTYDFGHTSPVGESYVEEPSGVKHSLIPPKDADLVVQPGRSLDAVLVFSGAIPPEVTSLNLTLGGFINETAMAAKLTIPAGEANLLVQGATHGQVAAETPKPEPRVSALPASTVSPAPTEAALPAFNLAKLPTTSTTEYGPVRTSITGVTLGSTSSAPSVDPGKDAEAERSLKELGAQKTADGWVLTLPETVTFDYNLAELKPEASATIAKVAKLLAYYDKAQIAVQGHTDSTGDAAGNLDLSQRRADAVAKALAGGGVQMSRMKVEGFGLTRPVASNADDAGRAKNRRVEIVLRENA